VIRIAAVADIHAGPETAGQLAPLLTGLRDEADLLLLAVDLTRAQPRHPIDQLDAHRGLLAPCVTPAMAAPQAASSAVVMAQNGCHDPLHTA
jgi:hypothetical protein